MYVLLDLVINYCIIFQWQQYNVEVESNTSKEGKIHCMVIIGLCSAIIDCCCVIAVIRKTHPWRNHNFNTVDLSLLVALQIQSRLLLSYTNCSLMSSFKPDTMTIRLKKRAQKLLKRLLLPMQQYLILTSVTKVRLQTKAWRKHARQ